MHAVRDTARRSARARISALLVPTTSRGYNVTKVDHTMGQRASDHRQIFFEDCEVPADMMLGEEGHGCHIALANLEGGRIGDAAQSLGMARSACEIALRYARERQTFGRKIIDHQAVGFLLAGMTTGLQAAELMILHAARLGDDGRPALAEASVAKLFAIETAERVRHDAIQILGGYGYLEDFGVERIHRDVRVCKIYEGTSEIQRMVINRQLAAG